MAQIFHRSTNTIARVSIYGAVILIAILGYAANVVNQTSYVTDVHTAQPQPVPFSHKHHVAELGLDCRYCHTSVEVSSSAGMPPTETCMTCHSQIWTNAAILEPVRVSYRDSTPISWTRVNALPDFVYFNHSIHINKGVGCTTCHGPVGEMNITWRENTLYMRWCLIAIPRRKSICAPGPKCLTPSIRPRPIRKPWVTGCSPNIRYRS